MSLDFISLGNNLMITLSDVDWIYILTWKLRNVQATVWKKTT